MHDQICFRRIYTNQRTSAPGFPAARSAPPQTANAAQLMQACAAHGLADMDHSALVQALEIMSEHAVAPAPAKA